MIIPVLWMERFLRRKMFCKKCKGRVLVDRSLCEDTHVELYCLSCGKRWSLNHPQNHGSFGVWIQKLEMTFLHKSSLAS